MLKFKPVLDDFIKKLKDFKINEGLLYPTEKL